MRPKLDGMNILITGASSGLGFEMTRALLGCGANVAMAARPGDKLSRAVNTLETEGFAPLMLPMDVTDEASIDAAKERLAAQWDRLDMLINNAGISIGSVEPDFPFDTARFYDVSPSAFRAVVETNFTGYFLVSRAFVPLMVAQGCGRVVNVSTSLTTMSMKGQTPYGPARAGAEALTMLMSAELEPLGITVNVLLPGGAADTGLIPPGKREQYLARGVLPATIMNEAVMYLASPEAAGVTGQRFIGKEFQR